MRRQTLATLLLTMLLASYAAAASKHWMTTPNIENPNRCTMTTPPDAAPLGKPSPARRLGQAVMAENLTSFTEFAFSVVRPGVLFKPNWHFEAVTDKLAQVASGEVRRLIINLPPRNLKSLCASVALPAWFLGHSPWSASLSYRTRTCWHALMQMTFARSSTIQFIKRRSRRCVWSVILIARSRPRSGASELPRQSRDPHWARGQPDHHR